MFSGNTRPADGNRAGGLDVARRNYHESRDVPNNNWETVNWCDNTIYNTNILRTVYTMARARWASVLFMCILYSVTSFNLEPRIPVIKFGEPGSYFGFSVAEHLTISGDGSKTSW